MDGYIRVSRVGNRRGPRFVSPDLQREEIVRWAARSDVEILELFEELDESGARADRPLLGRAIQRIEAGVSGGLVVWRVDRFGRSLADGVHVIDRIQNVGGGFYSVQDGLDISTDAGRLVLRILLSVAEYQLDGIRATWRAARERAIRRGVFIAVGTIVGYRKTPSGRLRPDPETGPVITEVFRRRALGDSVNTLCRYLEEQGVRTGKGNRGWSNGTLRGMFRSRAYLGEVYSAPFVKRGAHVALTDPATWQAAQRPSNVRRHEDHRPALLVGLVRCASCSHCLSISVLRPTGKPPRLFYRCRRFHAAGTCPGSVAISADKLEAYVVDVMYDVLGKRRGAPVRRLAEAEARAAAADEALVRYRDTDHLIQTIGEDAYLEGLQVRRKRSVDANLAVVEARAKLGIHALPPVADVRAAFPSMAVVEQRFFVARVIDAVFVSNAHGPAKHRTIVCPAGTAPRPLPRSGDTGRVMRTITPRRGWINPVPPAAKWSANPDAEPWVAWPAVAEHFAISKKTVQQWKRDGMPSEFVDRRRLYRLSQCQEWYDERFAPATRRTVRVRR
jgi:DNA invertase Pin-like site-specific DNA recombinase